jgi:sec-independent protein translocase protein TatC
MSGALDEDTARTLASGRQTVGSILSSAQQQLKKVFLVFVVGFLGTFYALRAFLWDELKNLVYANMSESLQEQVDVIAKTPFEVILLQVKIGIIIGIIIALPAAIYYGRDGLKRRGYWPDQAVPLWKKVGFVVAILLLFTGGIAYGVLLFFPIMFNFLGANAASAGLEPTWQLTPLTEFTVFLGLSFGVAGQLPLAMSASARTGVVPYETFRDRWRYAVVGIFLFGALFSPPDPFTQVMWGVPLVALYFVSLGIAKVAVLSKRAKGTVPAREIARENWNALAGAAVLAAGFVYLYLLEGGVEETNDLLAWAGSSYTLGKGQPLFGLSPELLAAGASVVIALVAVGELLFYLRIRELEAIASETPDVPNVAARKDSDAEPGEDAEIDVAAMSARAIEAAPAEAFVGLDEDEVLGYAQRAVDRENPEKAQLILDRYDEASELEAEREQSADDEEEEGNFLASTAAGVVDPFTEDETTEDDIGGYYYDLAFILDSLTSKAIWLVATFLVVLAGSFFILLQGGLEVAVDFFTRNMEDSAAEQFEIVVLHPVEALIFMLKFSTLLAAVSIIPFVVYFAWPAIEERFSPGGSRNILLVWGGTLLLALFVGTVVGFVFVAPAVISMLANDIVSSNMVIAYRISSFGWMVIYLTVGLGTLTMIPITMVLFHHGNIVSYGQMRKRWRVVVMAFFLLGSFMPPSGVFAMFLVAIPTSLAYGAGIGLVWVYDRLSPTAPTTDGEPAD